LVSGVRPIGSSGSGAVSDLCSGSVVSGFVLHDKEEVQSKCLNGVPCMVGSPPTKLRESLSLSDSGVGVCDGGLERKRSLRHCGIASNERQVDCS
jgi:hypothetical protein